MVAMVTPANLIDDAYFKINNVFGFFLLIGAFVAVVVLGLFFGGKGSLISLNQHMSQQVRRMAPG